MKKIIFVIHFFSVSFMYAMENKTNVSYVKQFIEKNLIEGKYYYWEFDLWVAEPLIIPVQPRSKPTQAVPIPPEALDQSNNEYKFVYTVQQNQDSQKEVVSFIYNKYEKVAYKTNVCLKIEYIDKKSYDSDSD